MGLKNPSAPLGLDCGTRQVQFVLRFLLTANCDPPETQIHFLLIRTVYGLIMNLNAFFFQTASEP